MTADADELHKDEAFRDPNQKYSQYLIPAGAAGKLREQAQPMEIEHLVAIPAPSS